ncbi:hypothetical protein [Phytohalomonas tamaricis]|uniref:hypothetical protein n=1 Tax=Phytohalomonas tamaricis TaxID=2081032 RepID=UPI001319C0DD|nr:hypothetical protein [Phytohalomonas tamaricis]
MTRTSNEICSMAFSTAEMKRRVINVMMSVEVSSPEPAAPRFYTHLTLSPRTLDRIGMDTLVSLTSELARAQGGSRPVQQTESSKLTTGEILERALREELLLLEELFPEEPALKRKIAQLKWFLAHAQLEEVQP